MRISATFHTIAWLKDTAANNPPQENHFYSNRPHLGFPKKPQIPPWLMKRSPSAHQSDICRKAMVGSRTVCKDGGPLFTRGDCRGSGDDLVPVLGRSFVARGRGGCWGCLTGHPFSFFSLLCRAGLGEWRRKAFFDCVASLSDASPVYAI